MLLRYVEWVLKTGCVHLIPTVTSGRSLSWLPLLSAIDWTPLAR